MKTFVQRYHLTKKDSEQGAISTLVLILFSSGLVVVLLALVVDSGALQIQRRSSQAAADQVAIAMAMFCSSPATAADCAPSGTNEMKINQILAAANVAIPAKLGEVCGSVGLNSLRPDMPHCTGLQGITRDCVEPDLATYPWLQYWVRNYVNVTTASQTSALFPLTRRLLGGAATATVWACAQYAWGPADKIKVVNSVLPLAFNPCEISVASSNLVAMTSDASTSACIIEDYSNNSLSFSKHGMYRWEAGATSGPCANGTTLDIAETICISAKTPTQTGVYYPNSLQVMLAALVTSQARTQLPVVNGLNGATVSDGIRGSFNTATVIGFVDLKIKGYKSGSSASGTAPAAGWSSACANSAVMCINATLNQRLSTQGTIVQNLTTGNFGVTSLSPTN